jgi:hypothetical protein
MVYQKYEVDKWQLNIFRMIENMFLERKKIDKSMKKTLAQSEMGHSCPFCWPYVYLNLKI